MNMQHLSSRTKLFAILVPASLLLAACGGGAQNSNISAAVKTQLPASVTSVSAAEQPVPANKAIAPELRALAASAKGAGITDIKIQNLAKGSQSNVPVTFGQVFVPGDVPAGSSVVATATGGGQIPLQVDVKATHPDGSLRHAVFTTILPSLNSGQTLDMQLQATSHQNSNGSALSVANLLAAGFTASVNVNVGGQIYTASADALLKSGKYNTWLSGPLSSEWLVSSPLMSASGTPHPQLSARFAIRTYSGYQSAKVDVVVENDWAYAPAPQNYTYALQTKVGGNVVYNNPAVTQYAHTRWKQTYWWGSAPQVHVMHNIDYLISTKAVPNYDRSFSISNSEISALNTVFAKNSLVPMGTGLANPYMPTTGGRLDIGLLPGWSVMYLLSMDSQAKNLMMGTADFAGSWSAHYRDQQTDRPVSLKDYPYMTILGNATDTMNPVTHKYEAFPVCSDRCPNPNVADSAHEPSFNYLPYIVTGDFYQLEELQFWAMWNVLKTNPGYRHADTGYIYAAQVRDQAWTLRTLADAAYISPDNDSLKPQFTKMLNNNLDYYNATYTNNPQANALGFDLDHALDYNGGLGMSPWMDDFFTSSIGHLWELGYSKAQPLLNWKAKFPVGRMTAPGFCWIYAAVYSMNVRATPTSPLYTTFAQAYQASVPASQVNVPCNSAKMAANLPGVIGEMSGYATEGTGFPSNFQPALAMSVDVGAKDAVTAWSLFLNRPVKPDYTTAPEFAIVPRSYHTTISSSSNPGTASSGGSTGSGSGSTGSGSGSTGSGSGSTGSGSGSTGSGSGSTGSGSGSTGSGSGSTGSGSGSTGSGSGSTGSGSGSTGSGSGSTGSGSGSTTGVVCTSKPCPTK